MIPRICSESFEHVFIVHNYPWYLRLSQFWREIRGGTRSIHLLPPGDELPYPRTHTIPVWCIYTYTWLIFMIYFARGSDGQVTAVLTDPSVTTAEVTCIPAPSMLGKEVDEENVVKT